MTYVQPACFSGTWLQVTGAMMIFIAPKLHLRKLGACDGGDMVKRGWGYGLDLSNHSRMQSWNLWRFIGKWDYPQNFRCIKIVFFFHVIWVVACGGEIDSCIRGWTVDLKGMWYLWVHHWWVRSKGIPLIWVTVRPWSYKKRDLSFFLTSQAVFLNYGRFRKPTCPPPLLPCPSTSPPASSCVTFPVVIHQPTGPSPRWKVRDLHGVTSRLPPWVALALQLWSKPSLFSGVIGIGLRVLFLLQVFHHNVAVSIPNWWACPAPCSLATNFFRIHFRARLGAP